MLLHTSIQVKCPATIANLVCGFDILGLALEEPYDTLTMELIPEPTIQLSYKGSHALPNNPLENVAGVSLLALQKKYTHPIGFKVNIEKGIKPGSGLGSSAASAAGAVVAANYLLGNPFTKQELISFALEGEKLASGNAHADNIAPCTFGGITLIRSANPLDIIPLSFPPLYVAVVHPQIELKTSDARQILKKQIPLNMAIKQWGNIAGLVTGLLTNDYNIIRRSLVDDIIEPIRSMLIPGLETVKRWANYHGALGGGIAGSGPTIFMLCETKEIAEKTKKEMETIFHSLEIENKTYLSELSTKGCSIIAKTDSH